MKTYSAKPEDIKKEWYLFDAEDLILGRLAAEAASLLKGKNNPLYSPNIDCGHNVVIINADKVALTGRKKATKLYQWHTGYPGGIKSKTVEDELSGKSPERVIKKAIQRMLPRSPLGNQQFKKLHVYAGSEHPHSAQKPQIVDFVKRNRKNKKGEE